MDRYFFLFNNSKYEKSRKETSFFFLLLEHRCIVCVCICVYVCDIKVSFQEKNNNTLKGIFEKMLERRLVVKVAAMEETEDDKTKIR